MLLLGSHIVLACLSTVLLLLMGSPGEVSAANLRVSTSYRRPIYVTPGAAKSPTSPSTPSLRFVTITEKNALRYNTYVDKLGRALKKEAVKELKDQAVDALKDLLANSDPPTSDAMATPTSIVATNYPTYIPPCTPEEVSVFSAWNAAFAACSGVTPNWFASVVLPAKQNLVCSNGCISRRAELKQKLLPTCVVAYNGFNVDMYSYFLQLVSPCWSW